MLEINKITDITNCIGGLKTIIFDLDDTLYNEKDYVRSGYCEVAKILKNIDNAEEKLWCFFEQNKSAIDELLISEKCYSEELKKKCLEIYRNQKPNIFLNYKVENMLIKLKDSGYKLGLITDGRPEGQKAKIDSLGLDKYFDKIIITDELGGINYRKPNLIAFKLMKNYFSVEYCEMCYIGDNINKDFIAPDKLGMRSIWFKNKDGLYIRNK